MGVAGKCAFEVIEHQSGWTGDGWKGAWNCRPDNQLSRLLTEVFPVLLPSKLFAACDEFSLSGFGVVSRFGVRISGFRLGRAVFLRTLRPVAERTRFFLRPSKALKGRDEVFDFRRPILGVRHSAFVPASVNRLRRSRKFSMSSCKSSDLGVSRQAGCILKRASLTM